MKSVVVDASVWVASQDPEDSFCLQSRVFLSYALENQIVIHVPTFARVEVACALARKLRNASSAARLTNRIFQTACANEVPADSALLISAMSIGTTKFLRGADALYSATAELTAGKLVSWDNEHIQRAEAWTPDEWLKMHQK